MKKNIIFVVLFLLTTNLYSQIDSLENRRIYNWKLNPYDLSLELVEVDTSLTLFQNYHPLSQNTISSNYLGNLGSAAQSKIYYDREKFETGFLFSEPYALYFHLPKNQLYYNTKRQFTLFNYSNAGPKKEAEQVLGVLHTQNVNKDFNLGFDFDMISSDGRYQNQELKQNKITVFSSYQKKGYRLHTNMGLNRLRTEENGGIDSVHYLNENEYKNRLNIPVKLSDARTQVLNTNLYLAHEYRFGKTIEEIKLVEKEKPSTKIANRDRGKEKNKISISDEDLKGESNQFEMDSMLLSNQNDSISLNNKNNTDSTKNYQESHSDTLKILRLNGFSVSHEMFYDKSSREFFDDNLNEVFYNDKMTYIDSLKIHDKVSQKRFGNKVSFHFRYLDKFSTRLSFYDEQMAYKYNIIHDTIFTDVQNIDDQDTIINTELEKKLSNGNVSIFLNTILFNHIIFSTYGEYYLYGYKKEDVKIDFKFAYKIWNNTELSLEGKYKNARPNYFYEKFSSNFHIWDNNNLANIEEWDAGLALRSSKYKLYAKIRYGQISNHIYLDSVASIKQYSEQINILSGELTKSLAIGPVKSITKFVYQQSSNDSILSLPRINLYQSLYFERLTHFKATGGYLLWQIGFDYRYTSNYMSDGYMPTSGLFHRQFEHEQVDYHCFDVFANITIKRLRLYLKYNYLNSAINDNFYFAGPYYPVPEPLLKFGLAWTFYD